MSVRFAPKSELEDASFISSSLLGLEGKLDVAAGLKSFVGGDFFSLSFSERLELPGGKVLAGFPPEANRF
jgi:hypothetical protein